MAGAKTFWTSVLDGITGEGIFGDLRIPGDPVRLFKEEPEEPILKLPANWGDDTVEKMLATRESLRRTELQGREVVTAAAKGESPRFYGGGLPYDTEQIAIDINGEHLKIARDREKGWVIVSAATMQHAEATKHPAR